MNIAGVLLFVQAFCAVQMSLAQFAHLDLTHVIPLQAVPELLNARSFCKGLDRSWYVIDGERQRIVRFDSTGHMVDQVGRLGWRDNEFDGLLDIHTADGLNIFAVDANNRRLQRYGRRLEWIATVRDGQFSSGAYDKSYVAVDLGRPAAVAATALGDIFYIDDQAVGIARINRRGKIDLRFGGVSAAAGKLRKPSRIAASKSVVVVCDQSGTIVYDYFGQLIRRVESERGRPMDVAIDRRDRIWILYGDGTEVLDPRGTSIGQYSIDESDLVSLDVDSNLYVLALNPSRILIYSISTP